MSSLPPMARILSSILTLPLQPLDIHVFFMRNWDAQLSETAPEETEQTERSSDPFFSYAYPSASSSISRSRPSSSSSATATPSTSALNPMLSPCGWQRDWESVQNVCNHIGIPRGRVKLVDLSKEYWTKVFEPALRQWENGQTPNPDVACNRYIPPLGKSNSPR